MGNFLLTRWVDALSQSCARLCDTPVAPGKDTHGAPVSLRRKAVDDPSATSRDHQQQRKLNKQGLETNALSEESDNDTLGNMQSN